MVNIYDLAKYTILRLLQNGNSICHLKLQKILYYIQSWYMVYFNKKLIFKEAPEAWVNGPVYRGVYDLYKDKGMYEQFQLSDILSSGEDVCIVLSRLHDKLKLSVEEWSFLEAIYKHYGTMSHDYLVFLTHSQKPWNKAREGLQPFEYTDQEISFETMYEYYSKAIEK